MSEHLTKQEKQVVKDEAAAEVVYQAEVVSDAADAEDERMSQLPAQTRLVRQSQKEKA